MHSPIPVSPRTDDEQFQRVVLLHLLMVHPSVVSEDELLLAVVGADAATQRDAATRAVRDLHAAGLLHRVDRFVVLTQPAVRAAALLDGS